VAAATPRFDHMPAGPFRDLVTALRELHRAAGKPSVRAISGGIKNREDLRDTVSHETISAMLRGDGLPRWIKVECVVRQLAGWAVGPSDPDREVRRFHALWLAASDAPAAVMEAQPRAVGRDFVSTFPPAERAPGAAGNLGAEPMISNRPVRNGDFTGREQLLSGLRAALVGPERTAVALHGFGGVGKTQLAVEYAHRWGDQYDLMWWIPGEEQAQTMAALAALGDRLGLPVAADIRHTARNTLEALETSALRWLLVLDNADAPDEVVPLLPAAGGHVIVTSRNSAWATVGTVLEVDVFTRQESVEFLRDRGTSGAPEDVRLLAEHLGDLPLALSQVSAMHLATGMPIAEYLRLFTEHLDELLSAGRPVGSAVNVTTFVTIAFARLRAEAPAAAQLLELLAFMAAEPVSLALLRIGLDNLGNDVSPPLSRTVHSVGAIDRVAEQAVRFGLARVEPDGPRIQVHRLVQLVLRETLGKDAASLIRRDVHRLLAAANPGDPDDPSTWAVHGELGPHLRFADAIHTTEAPVRRLVLDQIRYLERSGNYEASADLGDRAVEVWQRATRPGGLGPGHEDTILAVRHLANARRALGDYRRSQDMIMDLLNQLRRTPQYGEDHRLTLQTAAVAGFYLRIAGAYQDALTLDQDTVERRSRLLGDDDPMTLMSVTNLAINLRFLGKAAEAYDLDSRAAATLAKAPGPDDPRTLVAIRNLARDLFDLGRYEKAIEVQQAALPDMAARWWRQEEDVVRAVRTVAIAQRKAGQYATALDTATTNYRDCQNRFGPDHELTLAAMMTYANTMRTVGDAIGARSLATEALHRYRQIFGQRNPLTLAAASNYAIILRALGGWRDAYGIDELTLEEMRRALGPEHPHTLATAVGLANDLAHNRGHEAATALGERTFEAFRRVRTDNHPETWICAVNLARDRLAVGQTAAAGTLARDAMLNLKNLLGAAHPELRAAARGDRLECDLEPPPT